MKTIIFGLAALTTWCLLPPAADAQPATELWAELGASREVSERVEVALEGHLRFGGGARVVAAMPELGVGYEATKWLDLGLGYRLEYERDGGSGVMEGGHRSHGQAQMEADLGQLEVGYRVRYQYQVRGFGGGDGTRHAIRHKAGAEWEGFDAWAPYADTELFLRVGDGDGIEARKQRVTIGVEYDIGKQELDVFYRADLPFDNDPLLHIVGVQLHVDL